MVVLRILAKQNWLTPLADFFAWYKTISLYLRIFGFFLVGLFLQCSTDVKKHHIRSFPGHQIKYDIIHFSEETPMMCLSQKPHFFNSRKVIAENKPVLQELSMNWAWTLNLA